MPTALPSKSRPAPTTEMQTKETGAGEVRSAEIQPKQTRFGSFRSNKQLVAWALLILLAIIWGNSFILIKKSLLAYSAGEVGALRIIAAGLALLPIAIKHVGALSGRNRMLLLVIGLVGSFIPAFLFAKAQTQLSSSVTGILNALTPLFVVVIGAIFFGHRFTVRNAIGLAISFGGSIILALAKAGGELGSINLYAFLVILATLCYGLNLNIIKAFLGGLRPVVITAVSLALVLPGAVVYLFGFTDFTHHLQTQPTAGWSLLAVVTLGVVGTAIALILFNHLVQITTPMFTSFTTYLIPIVAVIVGVLDGEVLLTMHFVGMAAVIAGVYIANQRPKLLKVKL
ncbi:putative permease [Flammeovirgaceae bacterium 311]|nr:putative permease [Flammeovirgaceae bacterium 311]